MPITIIDKESGMTKVYRKGVYSHKVKTDKSQIRPSRIDCLWKSGEKEIVRYIESTRINGKVDKLYV